MVPHGEMLFVLRARREAGEPALELPQPDSTRGKRERKSVHTSSNPAQVSNSRACGESRFASRSKRNAYGLFSHFLPQAPEYPPSDSVFAPSGAG